MASYRDFRNGGATQEDVDQLRKNIENYEKKDRMEREIRSKLTVAEIRHARENPSMFK